MDGLNLLWFYHIAEDRQKQAIREVALRKTVILSATLWWGAKNLLLRPDPYCAVKILRSFTVAQNDNPAKMRP